MASSPSTTESSPRSAPRLAAVVTSAMLTGAIALALTRFLFFAGRGLEAAAEDALRRLPSLLLMWGGVGVTTGLALGYFANGQTSPVRKLATGVLVGALTLALGMALYSPFWPWETDEPARPGGNAVLGMLVLMGAVAGGILGAIAAWVSNAARVSLPRAFVRAAVCGFAYAVWAAATAR